MKIKEVKEILKAEVLCCDNLLDNEVHTGCGSDLMSDVLAFAKDRGVLLTGLNNPQVVRTAEMMDMPCIVFVRGKKPCTEVIRLATETGIVILTSPYPLFIACSKLYENGLRGSAAFHD